MFWLPPQRSPSATANPSPADFALVDRRSSVSCGQFSEASKGSSSGFRWRFVKPNFSAAGGLAV
jgi:hypothetical protein